MENASQAQAGNFPRLYIYIHAPSTLLFKAQTSSGLFLPIVAFFRMFLLYSPHSLALSVLTHNSCSPDYIALENYELSQ